MILGRLERYIWEQDTRVFNVAIVVPVGVLLPLEREEKRKACSTIHSRFQIDKTTTLCAKRFILCLFNSLFIYLFIYFILILLVIHFLIDVIHCKLCRKRSVRLFVIIIIIFVWYQSREMYDRTSSPIIVKTEQYLLLLHIIFYYIDTSVLLENMPLVKFINTTSGTRVVYFP